MGYYVRRLLDKKSAPNWKIQIISHRKADFSNSPAKKRKKDWDLPRSQWRALGFHDHQSHAEAQARARQLNSKLSVATASERRRQIELARQTFTKAN